MLVWLVACQNFTRLAVVEPEDWLEPVADAPTEASGPSDPGPAFDFPAGIWCTSLDASGDVVVINVDAGEMVTAVRTDRARGTRTNSLAVLDDEIVYCNAKLRRIDLDDGSVTVSPTKCQSAADFEGRLHVLTDASTGPPAVVAFDDFEHAILGWSVGEPQIQPHASRVGREEGEHLLTSWHSAPRIERWENGRDRRVPLRGFDTWIDGLSGVADSLLVLDDGRDGWGPVGDKALHHFDLEGRRKGRLELGEVDLAGLSCSTYPDLLAPLLEEDPGDPGIIDGPNN
ncbi:MAG: hypothetical protein AAF211_28780 [Myxococcota bacterium]